MTKLLIRLICLGVSASLISCVKVPKEGLKPASPSVEVLKCLEDAYRGKGVWVIPKACESRTTLIKEAEGMGLTKEVDNRIYLNEEGLNYVMSNQN